MKRSTQNKQIMLIQTLRVISFISLIGMISSGAGAETGEAPAETTAGTQAEKGAETTAEAKAKADQTVEAKSDSSRPSSFIQLSWFNGHEASKAAKSSSKSRGEDRKGQAGSAAAVPGTDGANDGAAIFEMASSLRRLGREKASAQHLGFFEEPIRRMTDVLDEHEQNWLQTDRTELARLAERLREEGQKRLADRRVTYSWAHHFVLRSILLFERDAAKSASLRELIGDAGRFDRAFARGLVDEPALQAFQKQLDDVRILITEFPRIVVEPTVSETASVPAALTMDHEGTHNRVYTIQAASTVKDVEGRELSPLILYLDTASRVMQDQNRRVASGGL